MYDKRFHNEKHNVKASIAVGLPGLFSPSECNNVEASKRINVATESITEVENTMEMMIPWVITQVIATNTGILVIWSPSSSYRICERIAKKNILWLQRLICVWSLVKLRMIFWRNFGKVCIQCDLSLTRRQLLPGLNLVRRQRLGEAKEPPWHSTAHLSTLNRTWTFWTREPLRIFDTFDIIWWYMMIYFDIFCV